ncbi:DUF983 domain-containing protein [Parasediminibacterium sp. JCM 36343]|uniref:DUF983 domain-containing protein n=1 Tax=Parasediminibacterium sp. JCM 36343 TaxID=3374279 RepID=UPI00397CA49B
MENIKKKKSYLLSLLANKCPRCREGDLFVSNKAYALKNGQNVKMHEKCPVCGQPTELEVGFYYGTSYVSYALTVAFSGFSFAAWFFTIGFNLEDNRIFWWLGLNAFVLLLLQPLFMRISRSLWISWFVDYDTDWNLHQPKSVERIVPEHMNNW